MRKQKIRGIKRKNKAIEQWIADNLPLRIDLLEIYQEDHCDIVVHPWCDYSISSSIIPPPKGKTKLLMIQGLVRIYRALKEQLAITEQPYYLKIWLFNPRFSLSRVVCAVSENKKFYETQLEDLNNEELPMNVFTNAHPSLAGFSWKRQDDNECYSNSDLGSPEDYSSREDYLEQEKWFFDLLKRTHKIITLGNAVGNFTEAHCFRRGDMWIGGTE